MDFTEELTREPVGSDLCQEGSPKPGSAKLS